jgi:hypothetical protein
MKVTQATGQQMAKETGDDTKVMTQVAEDFEKETTDAVKHVVQIPTTSTRKTI